jgi:hypothetical protein
MEVVGVEFIALNHHIVVANFLPHADDSCPWVRRSAPAHQLLETQQSAVTAISTAISALNVLSDVR